MSDVQLDAKAHLKEHGWVRIPSVISEDEASHALDRLWKAKAAVEAEGEETYLEFLDPNPSNVRVFYLMQVLPPIYEKSAMCKQGNSVRAGRRLFGRFAKEYDPSYHGTPWIKQ